MQVLRHVIASHADDGSSDSGSADALRRGDVHAMRTHPRVDVLAQDSGVTFGGLGIKRELVRVEAAE